MFWQAGKTSGESIVARVAAGRKSVHEPPFLRNVNASKTMQNIKTQRLMKEPLLYF